MPITSYTIKINIKNMSEFFEIADLKYGPIQYCLGGYRSHKDNEIIENYYIHMCNHNFPTSVRVDEFNFLKRLIIKYNLKSGFELATAFGVSTVALGIGFKENGGKLLTMDAYVEERQNVYTQTYENTTVNHDSDGFKSVNYLIEHFRLKEVVNPQVGWSPKDVLSVVKNHSKKTFDFLFLDGGHHPNQIIQDLFAIRPFLEEEYVIVLHDFFTNVYTKEVLDVLKFLFGIEPIIELKQPFGEDMAVIYNKKI